MSERTKWMLLGGLVLGWVALVVLRIVSEPEPQRAPLTFKSGQTAAQAVAKGSPTLPPVVRPVLARASQIPFKTSKNIFAPLEVQAAQEKVARAKSRKPVEKPSKEAPPSEPVAEPAAAPAPPPPSPEEVAAQLARQQLEQARQQLEQAEQQARQQKEQAAQQARQQMAQYRFLGYLTQQGEHRAFLGKGQSLFIVRIGDTVEGKIQVAAIDASAVKLRETSSNIETTIPLTKPAGPL